MKNTVSKFLMISAVVALAACGKPTTQELSAKAKDADTKAKLESALGKPDVFDKMGPIEKWTYHAADGDVVFVITGDAVALGSTAPKEEK